MNKHYILFVSHVLFGIIIAATISADLSLTVFNKRFPMELMFIVVFLPILTVASWRAATKASSRTLRNYFRVFRWLSLMLWVFNLFWMRIFMKGVPTVGT